MRFLVSDIKNAGRVDQTISVDPLTVVGNPPEYVRFGEPLHLKASAIMTGEDIVISGQLKTTLRFTCGRCLEEFDRPYEAEFQQVYGTDKSEIDMTSDIQEVIFVDLPLSPVCREECLGLCPTCGKNRNLVSCQCNQNITNPKWDALKEFRFIKK
ncbi:MAG: hypothetical protein KCHDKBKB_00076 [Elusimicrobia bacterium]|nr:hypothetical protein [Elusimicrobiota bacterium]